MFQNSGALLFTSKLEGQGLVLLEAQQQGCIPISYDVPFGPSDVITDGVDGFLVENRDVESMADKVEFLINNPSVAEKMSKDAIDSALKYRKIDTVSEWVNAKALHRRKSRVDHPIWIMRMFSSSQLNLMVKKV